MKAKVISPYGLMSHDVSVFNFFMSFKGLEANTLNFGDKNYVFFKFRETRALSTSNLTIKSCTHSFASCVECE